MPRDNNLLKEAVADAKALQAAAYANARLSLEEMFKPHMANLISKSLRSELNGLDEGINPGSSGIGSGLTVDEPAPKMPSSDTRDSSHIPNPEQEYGSIGEGFEEEMGDDDQPLDTPPAAAPSAGGPPPAAPSAPSADAPPMGMGGDLDVDVHGDGLGGSEMDMSVDGDPSMAGSELDLDAIIRELELDIQNDQAGSEQAGEAPAPQMESFQDPMAGAKVKGPMDGSLKEGDDPNSNSKDGKSPTAVDGINGGKKVTPGQKVTATAEEDTKKVKDIKLGENKEWELDEILREFEDADSSTNSDLMSENEELKESLKEHQNVVQFLRKKLHEINLLNSKLLFTNQLFKGFDLTGPQKLRVVETFDRAATMREAKLIYSTLAESFLGKTGKNSAKAVRAKALTEGLASKPVGGTAPKSQPIITENQQDEFVNRMKRLAGITK